MFRSAELMHKWWQCKSVDFITSIFKTSSNYYLSLAMYRKLLMYTLRYENPQFLRIVFYLFI